MSGASPYEDFLRNLGYTQGRSKQITGNLVARRALERGEETPERYREPPQLYSGFQGRQAPRANELVEQAADPETPNPAELRMANAAENTPEAFGMGEKVGGLGGLGGFSLPKLPGDWKGTAGDVLQAIGTSLMDNPRNNPLGGLGANYHMFRSSRLNGERLEKEEAEKEEKAAQQRAVMQDALKKIGFSDEDAALYSDNPKAAELVRSAEREKREEVKSSAARERAYAYLEAKHPDVAAMVASGLPLEDGWKMAAEARKSPEMTSRMRELVAAGLSPGSPEFKAAILDGGKGTTINNNMGSSDDGNLRKKLDERTGEEWAAYLDIGHKSAALTQDLQLLDELITVAPQGPISGRLAEMTGASDAGNAFNAVVKRVAPTLRAEGSGSTSDIEYDGMLMSLPRLRNNPEANRAVSQMMQAKQAINIERASIIQDYSANRIDRIAAQEQLGQLSQRSIMTPELQAAFGDLGIQNESPDAAPPGVDEGDWQYMSDADKALFR